MSFYNSRNGVEILFKHGTHFAKSKLQTFSPYEFDTDIDSLIAKLEEFKVGTYTVASYNSTKRAPTRFDSFELSYEDERYGEGKEYVLYGIRPATPEEIATLEQEIQASKSETEQRQRAEYERLKKKFEETC